MVNPQSSLNRPLCTCPTRFMRVYYMDCPCLVDDAQPTLWTCTIWCSKLCCEHFVSCLNYPSTYIYLIYIVHCAVPPNILDIESTPSSVAVRENQNINMTCRADGFPTPKIIWRRYVQMMKNALEFVMGGALIDFCSIIFFIFLYQSPSFKHGNRLVRG